MVTFDATLAPYAVFRSARHADGFPRAASGYVCRTLREHVAESSLPEGMLS